MKKIKNQISASNYGDLKPEEVNEISKRLNVKKEEVISMNRRMYGKEKSLNDPIKDEDGGEWQDWIADEGLDQELKMSQNIHELGDWFTFQILYYAKTMVSSWFLVSGM